MPQVIAAVHASALRSQLAEVADTLDQARLRTGNGRWPSAWMDDRRWTAWHPSGRGVERVSEQDEWGGAWTSTMQEFNQEANTFRLEVADSETTAVSVEMKC